MGGMLHHQGYEFDQPFYSVELLPIEKPTATQIKLVRETGRQEESNFLELRALLQRGGFQGFGLLLPSEMAVLSRKFDTAGIPYKVRGDPTPRMVRLISTQSGGM